MLWCNWSSQTLLLPCCTSSTAIKDNVVDPYEGPPSPGILQRKDALSTAAFPTRPASYYLEQCDLYFDSIQSLSYTPKPHRNKFPKYAKNVARWEWSPWLMLTSFGRRNLISIDKVIRLYPCICVDRSFRLFTTQPYVRCLVTLFYGAEVNKRELGLHIYEEFTFNDEGEMTFIEAWLCEEGLQLGSLDDEGWPVDEEAIRRLSTLLPGLGSASGEIDMKSTAFLQACQTHPEVEDYRQRVRYFYSALVRELVQDLLSKKKTFLGFPSKKSAPSRLRSRSQSTDTTAASSTIPHITPYSFNSHIMQRVPFASISMDEKEEELKFGEENEAKKHKYLRPSPELESEVVKGNEEEWKEGDPDMVPCHHHPPSRFHAIRDSRELYRGLQYQSSDFQEVPSEEWLEWEMNPRMHHPQQLFKKSESNASLYSEGENII